ncbi:MAG: hypothetical protein JWQ04_1819 [Pedosphaera sp.]|nr:hypothetical protein [Pedosphaera sp.]
MNETNESLSTRREFLKNTGRFAAASALVGMAIPSVHGAEGNTIQVALIGCGGRGGGAANNALDVKKVPMKLVAMADVFEHRLTGAYNALKHAHPDSVDVPPERRFIGFDGYKKAMDCLKPGDIVIFTTPLAFRWVHFTYAIEKKLNVFMEKPLTSDGPTSRRMFKLGEEASAKNLKVGVGLMSRHARPLQELEKRIQDGELGNIILMRGYRMAGPLASAFSEKWPGNPSELLWQISRFHSFIWASGGCFNDFYIHHIDHLCMMKGAWPVKAQALGGRHYRSNFVDQNFDSYSVEYTFADGAKMYMDGRCVTGCSDFYYSHAHGSKGMAVVSAHDDCGGPSSIHSGQNPARDNIVWKSKDHPGETDPYLNEWNDLVDAIINDKPYSEVKRGVEASLVTSLGRLAAHTGRETTYEQLLNSEVEYSPNSHLMTMDSPAPVVAGPDGKYPVPQPGIITDRDYQTT